MNVKLLVSMSLISVLSIACVGEGGGGAASTKATDQAPIEGTAPTSPDQPATPPFDQAAILGKVFGNANGGVTFSATEVQDTRCGGRYTIKTVSMSNGSVIVETDLVNSSYVFPGNWDCAVSTDQHAFWMNTICTISANKPAQDTAWHVTYKISEINGGIAIERTLKSRDWLKSCGPYQKTYVSDTSIMPEENYFE